MKRRAAAEEPGNDETDKNLVDFVSMTLAAGNLCQAWLGLTDGGSHLVTMSPSSQHTTYHVRCQFREKV